jgi:hypothetical protein
VSFLRPDELQADEWKSAGVQRLRERGSEGGETDRVMPYCITLRSRTDTRITGWYIGSQGGWSTDHKRQKLFDRAHGEWWRLIPRRLLADRLPDAFSG